MKKRILIPYATYGNGHKAVALYIKKYFEDNGNYECKAIDLMSYSFPLFNYISKKFSNFTMEKIPILWSIIYFMFDNKISSYISGKFTIGMLNNKKLRKDIEEFDPDITVSTHFFGNDLIKYYNKKNITNSKVVVVITDYIAHDFWLKEAKTTDAIIVSSIEEKFHLIKKGFKYKQVYTSGIPIMQETENLNKDKIFNDLKLDKNKKTILFFAGGSKGSLFNLIYFKELLKNKYDCNIIFIAGRNKLAVEKANEMVHKYKSKNVKVYGFATNVNELYYISDFVVTKPGGAQVTECLYYKKPMLLLKGNGGQEFGNRRYLCRKGFAKTVINPNKFKKCVKYLLYDEKYLNNMKKNLSKIKQSEAMKKLFNIVEKL